MNGITYNRFNSPYKGDKTKDCALSVAEMDNNFFVLEGRDVTSVEVNGDELVINLLNGDRISSKDAFSEFTKELSFDFDAEKGILTITRNDETYELCGFVTEGELDKVKGLKSSTDETIIGNGSSKEPLGVAPAQKTGQYRPVLGIIDNNGCGCGCGKGRKSLPKDAKAGDRYITAEKINDYGFLYGFEGVKKLICDLKAAGYEWDLPSKADWDNMLNAIEPKAEWANHNEVTTHKYLGKKAGQFLKAREGWKLEDTRCGCGCSDSYDYEDSNCDCGCDCGSDNDYSCYSKPVCGEQGACKEPSNKYPNRGIDKFGFAALPAGYADEEKNYMYYTERAYFWTKTNSGYGAYIKRFDFDASKVYQDTMDLDCYASVRLVKKYDGSNFKAAEEIFGESYPVVMIPSKDGGCSLWTSINIQFNNRCYKPLAIPVEDIECTTRYYINEWNGCTWVKNILKEGESVVVINAPKDKVCDEYRVVGGVLTRVNDAVFNDIMEAVEGELDVIRESIHVVNEKVLKLETRVEAVEEGLEAETERAMAAEAELDKKIDGEIERAMEEERRISAALEQETNDRIAEDNKIQKNLEQETNDRIMVDNQQWEAIKAEAEAREMVDNQQWEAIKKETEARILADGEIYTALGKEVADRIDEDGKLYKALEKEVADRIDEDNKIQKNLEQETNDRIMVDNQQWIVINDEIARAKAAEEVLQQNIDAEAKRAQDEEARIEAQIPDNGVYDNAEGKLTLNRGEEEKFSVAFSFDFGEF